MRITRQGITTYHWNQIKHLFPPEQGRRGRPSKPHRRILNGILWVLRTGAPWRDVPSHFGKWSTIASRFYRWRESGLWDQILDILRQEADEKAQIDWLWHFVDGTVIRTHKHAAGARKFDKEGRPRTPESLALGRSRGGFSTKVMIRVEGNGKPMQMVLAPGERHNSQLFEHAMEGGVVKIAIIFMWM